MAKVIRRNNSVQSSSVEAVGPSAESYQHWTHQKHVYERSSNYIGEDTPMVKEEWVFDFDQNRIVSEVINFIPACERLFLELITNASDNVGRSRRQGYDPGEIIVEMSNSTISVTNGGLPIPIEMHPTENMYVPQLIFGTLLTSSNYEGDRHEAGVNGIGAKATNVYSKYFSVEVFDHIRHKHYFQIWRDNMLTCEDPIIEDYIGNKSTVKITYFMDFARFGYPLPIETEGGYPKEMFSLFARHAADISFTAKVPVLFNNNKFNCGNIKNYAKYYYGDAVKKAIIHYEWAPDTKVITKPNGLVIAEDPNTVPIIELLAMDAPDAGFQVSFVNCMMTREGGSHVTSAMKAVGDKAVSTINDEMMKQLVSKKTGKVNTKEKRNHTLNIADVRPHISMLLSVKITNPKFSSQSKEKLNAPDVKINITDTQLRSMNNWSLMERLYAALKAKQFASLSKTNGRMKKFVKLNKGIDANLAGKKDRHQCSLYITEGRSAAAYAEKLIQCVPNGRDYIGILQMRGKGLNVMNANWLQIERNKEIAELKTMLGLVECADPNLKSRYYLEPYNYNQLRYGSIMIMADADVDGKHITGLILNYFHCQFPSLLARGYVMIYRSPILRATLGKKVHKFYTQSEYEKWKNSVPDSYRRWTFKYYKGLGSSSAKEIENDFTTPRVVHCIYDDEAPEAIRLAFDKNLTKQRKKWISDAKEILGAEEVEMQPISWFINAELIQFSIADTQRSLPKLMDGFKESQRKVMFAAHKKWKIKETHAKYQQLKVAQLGAFVAEKTNYHHGETILTDVIVNMTQDFVGSNNIPWFTQDGQFGTRFKGGKDASETRYTFLRPEKILPYILRVEDQPILTRVIDEGLEVEPETFYPIIPMLLVNGAKGIGTGWSTEIPCHNPLDIIKWLKMKLEGAEEDQLPFLVPWYNKFKGKIYLIDRRQLKKNSKIILPNIPTWSDLDKEDELIKVSVQSENGSVESIFVPDSSMSSDVLEAEDIDKQTDTEEDYDDIYDQGNYFDDNNQRPLLSMMSTGEYNFNAKGDIVVTELPIGRWSYNYLRWLEELLEDKKIRDFRNLSGGDKVYFEIKGYKGDINSKTLKLERRIGMSNMVALNNKGHPYVYSSALDLIDTWYNERLPFYDVRKQYMMATIKTDIDAINNKIKFIRAILDGVIVIINRPISEIHSIMDGLEIPHEIYQKALMRHISEDDIRKLMDQLAVKQEELNKLESTTIKQLWWHDLDQLEKIYIKIFKKTENPNKSKKSPPKIIRPESKPRKVKITRK